MEPITTIDEFHSFVSDFKKSGIYRDPVLFAIGGVVRTSCGTPVSVRYPVVNGNMKNTGTAAVIMKVLGLESHGVRNISLSLRQIQEILSYFRPFENDGSLHRNIQVLKMAQGLYRDKGLDSPGDAVVSFVFDKDSPVSGMEDATLRLYGRSLRLYQAHDAHLSEILMKLPCVIWENDIPIDPESTDECLLSAAFGGKPFAPNVASKIPLLLHRINAGKMGMTNFQLNQARLGTYIDEGGNIRYI